MRREAERVADVLDPRLMAPRLAAALGGAAICHVLDAKYEPGVRATVLYDLAGRLVRGDLLDPTAVELSGRPGAGCVIEPGMRVRLFPDDPDLPALPWLTDPLSLGPALARLRRPEDGRSTIHSRIRLLRYRPGKRATVLARVTPLAPAFVAKAYHKPDKAAAVAEEAAALAALPARGRTLRFAPPVGLVGEGDVVVQEAVGGTTLDVLLAGRDDPGERAVDGVRRAARALAELHELPAVTERQRSVVAELHRFGTRAAGVAALDPGFAARAAQVADRLLDRHGELPPATIGPVHGDCKPSQFLLSDTRVHLLDLDHFGISDQAADVGTFLATLRQLAVRRQLTRRWTGTGTELEGLEREFLRHYLVARGGKPDAVSRRSRWQQAVALERKALRAFARAPRSRLAPALLEEADRCMHSVERAA
ncbi:hypothetical protein [Nocardioides sp.]|uniref:hypothetical protein n=1 Tax=Nocardioides sp. TaxID=35761 RepID=UPI002ED0AF6B